MKPLEQRFIEILSRHNVPRPRVNTRIEGYEVDFAWPAPGSRSSG